MNLFRMLAITVVALLPGAALPLGGAVGQQKALKEQIVGTWSYVSVDIVRPDGTRVPLFGPDPSGLAIFESNGRYLLLTARANRQKFASNNRNNGTAEENKAAVEGAIAHFGKYIVNEGDKTITFQIETSTFPNWNGIEQKRPFTLTRDELKWTTAASSGGKAEVVLKRAK